MAKKPNSKEVVQRSRRKLLTLLSVGAAAAKLPDGWSKPTVASIMLPAHAKTTSPPALPNCDSATLLFANYDNTSTPGTYTIAFVGRAYGLPSTASIFCRFIYPGGTTVLTAPDVGGFNAASLNPGATVPAGILCNSSLTVAFYSQGYPGYTLCSDSLDQCTIIR